MASNTGLIYRTQFWLLMLIMVFLPLYRGGNRPLPLLLLEIAAFLLIVTLVVRPVFIACFSKPKIILLFTLALYPLLYLLPLPLNLWQLLPGRELFFEIYQLIDINNWRTLTLVPVETKKYLGVALVAIAVFLSATSLSERDLRKLVIAILVVACFESLLGLIQLGGSVDGALRFGNTAHGSSAIGTFANRNHLAGYLEMTLPVAMALLIARYGKTVRYQPYFKDTRQRLAHWINNYADHMIMFGAISVLILLGIVFSRSRTGLFLTMTGLLLFTAIFARRIGNKRSVGVTTSFLFVAVSVILLIGLAPVLQRFTDTTLLEDTRWAIFSSALTGIKTFFPLGSGPGTFAEIYPQFQPKELSVFVNYAHNDYLELFFESGVFGIIAVAISLYFYVMRWPSIVREKHWETFHYIQAGAGIGIGLMLLHSLTDFNLHIPANLMLFVFLAAIFFKGQKTAGAEKITRANQRSS